MSQEDVFLASEGDNYFKRNRDHLGVESAEPLLLLMERHGLKPKTILDIGCADGSTLARISQKWGSSWTGIEPGLLAVKEGQKKYKHLALKRGVASKIPLTAAFDLVIVNYVLHWVSREKLFLALTEIDRVTRFGGHLIIGDFFPDRPTKNPYHHTPRKKVWTYKADYAGMFTASGMYEQEGRIFFRHEGHVVVKNMKDVPSDHRGAVTLLKKIQ